MAANDCGARLSRDHDIVIINVDGLAAELQNLMADNLFMPQECCIFRVPTILLRHNAEAYAPNAFSIGPFHYKRSPLMEATQKIKVRYLHDLISGGQPSPQRRLRDVIKAVTDVHEAACKYYAGPIGMTMNEFVQVMVLDGCFIIELFRKKACQNLRGLDDPVFEMSCLLQFLYHDLIMLENQIPWVVLETLFNLPFVTRIDKRPLVQLAIEFFGNIFPTSSSNSLQTLLYPQNEIKHILDMLRNSLVWPSSVTNEADLNWQPMPSVTSLKKAGIKFKKGKNSKSILDVKFNKGVLEIPPLLVQETTEPLFRNLISFEQCCPGCQPVITTYAILMDNLINTNDDIESLSRIGILENWLSVDEATKFFNELYTDTYVKENYYLNLTKQVNEHCKRQWPRYRTVLVRDYFNHPWAFISLGVATFITVCTFIQTLFTIMK
ncbi:hypothetical protein L484_017622 [Morus notabilis]|uniref:Uncharacterized protein n=1 Tax=Morus notabilis TaxID=981085 RepID=W9SGF5_9ROSA|nr:UPF0481 protein At3g47200 [Morus notabilis]EXC31342.1 hypothetical protein L484_017622 [Morus notabilis]